MHWQPGEGGTSSWSPGPWPWCSVSRVSGDSWPQTSDIVTEGVMRPEYMRALCCVRVPYRFMDKPGLLMDDFDIFINTWTFNILQSMSFQRRFSCKLVQLTIVSMININPISQNAFQRPRNLLDACQLLIDVYWLATLSLQHVVHVLQGLQATLICSNHSPWPNQEPAALQNLATTDKQSDKYLPLTCHSQSRLLSILTLAMFIHQKFESGSAFLLGLITRPSMM